MTEVDNKAFNVWTRYPLKRLNTPSIYVIIGNMG